MSDKFVQPTVWTRQSIQHSKHRPGSFLPLGFEPGETIPGSGSFIPPCSYEDVDRAVIELFSSKLGFGSFACGTKNGERKWSAPFVKFASGERFAMSRRTRPDRDENGALILPIVAIKKKAIKQTVEDTLGHGMNQTTGEIVIRKQLSKEDDNYQTIINKLGLKNTNVNGLSTRREGVGNLLKSDPAIQEGSLLDPKIDRNIYEIIAIPQPQFYSVEYEITYWTNHIRHMNHMLQTTMNGFLPQDRMFRLNTPEGYWFHMYLDEDFSITDDLDDFTEEDRLIEYSFGAKVRAYLIAGSEPGQPVRIKRYYSSPFISFGISSVDDVSDITDKETSDKLLDKFALDDIQPSKKTTQEPTDLETLSSKKTVYDESTGNPKTVFVQFREGNKRKGESVYSVSDPELLLRLIYG